MPGGPLSLDQKLVLLSERQRAQYNALRLSVQEAVGRAWDALGNVSDEALEAFLRAVLPVVEAGATQVAATTTAMVAQSVTLAGGDAAAVMPATELGALRGGVPSRTVFSRPTVHMRKLLSDGMPWAQAKEVARGRAVGAASMDMAMAQRQAMASTVTPAGTFPPGTPHVVGYRRTLTGASCRFCAVASTQRYTVAAGPNLMPLHHHCDCGVAPIIGDHDPGQVINRDLLAKLKKEGATDYWSGGGLVDAEGNALPKPPKPPKVVESVHGELGPVFGKDAGMELSLHDRTRVDRDRAREILDTHQGDPAALFPGPFPPMPSNYLPPSPGLDATQAEKDAWQKAWDTREAEWKAYGPAAEAWRARNTEYQNARRASTLVGADGKPTAVAVELVDRTKATGAAVLSDARARIPDRAGMDAAIQSAGAEDLAASVAHIEHRDAMMLLEGDYRGRKSLELYGTNWESIRASERLHILELRDSDPEILAGRLKTVTLRDARTEAARKLAEAKAAPFIAERDAVMASVRQLRATGSGSDLTFDVASKRGEAAARQAAVKQAASYYPAEWTETLGKERTIQVVGVERGFCKELGGGRTRIALSNDAAAVVDPAMGAYGRVAVHELAHAIEGTNPDVRALEWSFLKGRTIGETPVRIDKSPAYLDAFPERYFGKVYGADATLGSGPLAGHFELLSTSMDTLVGGRSYHTTPMDDEHLSWLIGTLVVA